MSVVTDGFKRAFRLLQQESPWQGFFRMERYQLQHTLFSGGWSRPITRELFERGHAVAVLLYDPRHDEVVMVEQFRIGALDHERSPWMIEIVAGMVEPGESEPEVARRESPEEAGCRVGRLERIARYWVSPGGTSETITLYCGEVDSTAAGGVHGVEVEDEDILVHRIGYETLLQRQQQGDLESATPLLAVQWLQLNRERLRWEWAGIVESVTEC